MKQLTNNHIPNAGDALLVVDVQNDFIPGGSLAVHDGNKVVPVINQCIELFSKKLLPVYASRDWHPVNHCSFISEGGHWPPHCIAGSDGAKFPEQLALPAETIVITKANAPMRDAYSAFENTPLNALLFAAGIKRLFVCGLATDYSVLNTVLDAVKLGYVVVLLTDAIRAVEVNPGDGEKALNRMESCGANLITSLEIVT